MLNEIMTGVNAAYVGGMPGGTESIATLFSTVTSILLFVVGALAVIMVVVGGLRYVISGGNASAVSAAKNTVLYAIVGVVIAFLAYALINFVLGVLSDGSISAGGNWSNR